MVCDPNSDCVRAPDEEGFDDGTSCGVSPSGASAGESDGAPWRGALLFALAMTALAGRRRAARTTRHPEEPHR
jgi:hypothetical protein